MIQMKRIQKIYQMGPIEVEALKGVSLEIEPGEFVAVMGPSGSGKSTLMNLIGCLDRPSAGSYLLAGAEVSRFNDNQLAEVRLKRIGFVFQSFNLLPRLSAFKNVELPLLYAGVKERQEIVSDLLSQVGLEKRGHHRPSELSGGERQRVAIARALVNNPSLILADEPTGNVDSTSAARIMDIFREINKRGVTIVMVTHNVEVASYAGRTIRLKDGQLLTVEDAEGAENNRGKSSAISAASVVKL
ncbi:MAG: ABC transporter ATP-binding protein [bacterium]